MAATTSSAFQRIESFMSGSSTLSHRLAGSARLWAVASAAALMLLACTPSGSRSNHVVMSTAEHDSIGDLVASSEYLVRGRVLDAAGELSLDDEVGLAFYVNGIEVASVIAARPDVVTEISDGDMIRTGVVLLDLSKAEAISNFDDLAKHYPTESEAPAKDADLLMFLVDNSDQAADSSDAPDFAVVGYAVIGKDGELAWKGFPGGLAGSKDSLTSFSSEVLAQFDVPAPWRQVDATPDSVPDPQEGPDGRAPLSEPE